MIAGTIITTRKFRAGSFLSFRNLVISEFSCFSDLCLLMLLVSLFPFVFVGVLVWIFECEYLKFCVKFVR